MSKKPYNVHDRFFTFLITALCCCAAALILAIVIQSKLDARTDPTVPAMVESDAATAAPLTLVAQDSALASPSATAAPAETPTPSPQPTEAPEPFEYLPVYTKGDTTEKIIALTLDDVSNISSLKYAAQAAEHYGAKLTLFPIGSTIMTTNMTQALRTCVLELGYQVENRTQSNGYLYRMSDEDMAREILSPDIALDYALNKDYGMHLLRPRGAQGTKDPRTHAYLKKLGYDGFVTWTIDGTNASTQTLSETLAPGNIYLFECTKSSVEKMAAFMKYVHQQGYRMVTVNEVLGFGENTCADPTEDILSRQYPMPDPYERLDVEFASGDRAWQVLLIQSRLAQLGYLSSDAADGVYGDGTAKALMAFQAKLGLPCTGVATVDIQNRLFADDAPIADPTPTPTVTPEPTPEGSTPSA